jgi:hypothetical protein
MTDPLSTALSLEHPIVTTVVRALDHRLAATTETTVEVDMVVIMRENAPFRRLLETDFHPAEAEAEAVGETGHLSEAETIIQRRFKSNPAWSASSLVARAKICVASRLIQIAACNS